MGFGMLLVFLVLVYVIVRLLGGPGAFVGGGCCGSHGNGQHGGHHSSQLKPGSDPTEIVKARFARGEISQEEFEQVLATLRKN